MQENNQEALESSSLFEPIDNKYHAQKSPAIASEAFLILRCFKHLNLKTFNRRDKTSG